MVIHDVTVSNEEKEFFSIMKKKTFIKQNGKTKTSIGPDE